VLSRHFAIRGAEHHRGPVRCEECLGKEAGPRGARNVPHRGSKGQGYSRTDERAGPVKSAGSQDRATGKVRDEDRPTKEIRAPETRRRSIRQGQGDEGRLAPSFRTRTRGRWPVYFAAFFHFSHFGYHSPAGGDRAGGHGTCATSRENPTAQRHSAHANTLPLLGVFGC